MLRRSRWSTAVRVLALSGGVLVSRPAVAGLPSPGVVAIGGGVAIVEDAGWLRFFSLQDGAFRGAIELAVPIYEVHFDGRRSEFWGESWRNGPVVWSWRPDKPFRIEKIPASWIYKAFALRNGERLLAVTVSTAARDEDLHRSHIALAKWDGQKLRFIGLAPPYDEGASQEGRYVVMGAQALFSGFVDEETGRPIAPDVRRFSHDSGFFVWRPSPDRWEMVDSDTGQILESRDGGRSWSARGLLADENDPATLVTLEADPFRAGAAFALRRVEGDDGASLELWRSPTEESGWRPVWRGPSGMSEEDASPGSLLFDEEAVWIQATSHHSGTTWSIHLTAVPRTGAPRELTLRYPPTKGPHSDAGTKPPAPRLAR